MLCSILNFIKLCTCLWKKTCQSQSIKHLYLSWFIFSISPFIFYLSLIALLYLSSDGCSCNAGRHGDDCSSSCPGGFYGAGCSHPCSCLRGADCDPVRGACLCPPGRTGTLCQNGMRMFIQLLYVNVGISLVKYGNKAFISLLLDKIFLKDGLIMIFRSDLGTSKLWGPVNYVQCKSTCCWIEVAGYCAAVIMIIFQYIK